MPSTSSEKIYRQHELLRLQNAGIPQALLKERLRNQDTEYSDISIIVIHENEGIDPNIQFTGIY